MREQGRAFVLAALIAVLALVAAGCGGGDENSADEAVTTVEVTTEEPTTTEAATTTTTEETTGTTTEAATGLGKLADKDCIELAGVSAKFSQALSATGQNANFEATNAFFAELVKKAPDEIKDDLAAVAKAWGEMAAALKDLDLQSGQVPSAETIAKLQQLSTKFDTPELQQASKNLQAWSQKHCGTTTP
jgi:hypothetical protein